MQCCGHDDGGEANNAVLPMLFCRSGTISRTLYPSLDRYSDHGGRLKLMLLRSMRTFIASVVGYSYLVILLPLWPTMSSYPSTTPAVLAVRRASTDRGSGLGDLIGAGADLTEWELGNLNGAGADPTEQELENLGGAGADPTEQELGNLNGDESTEQELGNLDGAGVDPTCPTAREVGASPAREAPKASLKRPVVMPTEQAEDATRRHKKVKVLTRRHKSRLDEGESHSRSKGKEPVAPSEEPKVPAESEEGGASPAHQRPRSMKDLFKTKVHKCDAGYYVLLMSDLGHQDPEKEMKARWKGLKNSM
ncbi:hypothetical protein GW17_00058912, partial [Ensete ventricosum]